MCLFLSGSASIHRTNDVAEMFEVEEVSPQSGEFATQRYQHESEVCGHPNYSSAQEPRGVVCPRRRDGSGAQATIPIGEAGPPRW